MKEPPFLSRAVASATACRSAAASVARKQQQPLRKHPTDPLFGTAEGRAAAKAGRDVTETVNDPRPKLEIPASRNRLSSEFARDLGPILAKHEFFAKDSVPVCPDPEKASLFEAQ